MDIDTKGNTATRSRATPNAIFVAMLISLFTVAGQVGAQGGLPSTHSAKLADKPKVTP